MPDKTLTTKADDDVAVLAPTSLVIRSFRHGSDTAAFRALNEEWITRYFTWEAEDQKVLGDPEHSILGKGGCIFMVDADAVPVGCVALTPLRDGIHELSKMAVSPKLRGQGLGRRLLAHTIDHAKSIGAKRLVLTTNTKLLNAIHLYESLGFRHVSAQNLPPTPYTRVDVFMELAW